MVERGGSATGCPRLALGRAGPAGFPQGGVPGRRRRTGTSCWPRQRPGTSGSPPPGGHPPGGGWCAGGPLL